MDVSDSQIRRKYSLPDSIPVRRDMPSPEEIKSEPSFLLKVAQSFGYQEWMWKSWKGRILAMIVIPPALFGAAQWWYPKVQIGYEYAETYIQVLSRSGLELASEMIGFGNAKPQQPDDDGRFFSLNDKAILVPQTRYLGPPTPSSDVLHISLSLWRIVSARYVGHAFSSRIPVETRWLPKGVFVAYAAVDVLQAIAELYVVSKRPHGWKGHFAAVRASISGSAHIINLGDLPPDWASQGAGNMTRELGKRWIDENRTCMLGVPSVIQPSKHNFIINLQHPDARTLKVEEIIMIDDRLDALI